jgi:hypothetical protein
LATRPHASLHKKSFVFFIAGLESKASVGVCRACISAISCEQVGQSLTGFGEFVNETERVSIFPNLIFVIASSFTFFDRKFWIKC